MPLQNANRRQLYMTRNKRMTRVLGAGTISVTIRDYQHIPCLIDKNSMISQCEDAQSIIVLHKLEWPCVAMPVDMIYQHCSLFINLKPAFLIHLTGTLVCHQLVNTTLNSDIFYDDN